MIAPAPSLPADYPELGVEVAVAVIERELRRLWEQDTARAITDHFDAQISRALRSDIPRQVFLRTEVVNSWGRQALNDSMGSEFKGRPIQLIRNLAKAGFLPKADRELKRWPVTSRRGERVSGIAWHFEETTEEATVIGKNADGGITTEVR